MDFLKKFWSEEEGQGLVEYGLLVALIVVVVIAALTVFRTSLTTLFTDIGKKINGGLSEDLVP